jgi:hypothetical protein
VRARLLAIAVLLTLRVEGARAQDPVPASGAPAVLFGLEARRDRIRYHFDNPSSADTAFLVPHFFEQTYEADSLWLVTTARYDAGLRWETTAAITPERAGRADDYDTFIDPGDVLLVSGTTGDASMRSIRISQRADVGRLGAFGVWAGYRLTWDRFDFHLGHKTTTRDGALIAASDVTAPEMTDSKVHELLAGVRAAPEIGGGWRVDLTGEVSPVTLARLSVQLPEKYPGQDLVFVAKGFTASGRVALRRPGRRWPVEIAGSFERAVSYRSTASLSRSAQSVTVSAGRSW